MADFWNVQPDEYKYLGRNYTPGRPYGIKGVTIHHMAGDLDADGCNNVWRNREASAHYSIDRNGYIVQHVNDTDRAWACGDGIDTRGGNDKTISIEHANDACGPWTVYPDAIESGAHLVAALCRYYGLGRPDWLVNVFPHKYWSATSCPGELAGSQKAEYMAKAQAYYDEMTGQADNGGEWIQQDGKWWYRHADGSYTSDWWELIDGRWYHFDSSGWMQTGWLFTGGAWYWLAQAGDAIHPEGSMYEDEWALVDGKWYYLAGSGAMATGWVLKDGKWYYTDASGAMQIGWELIDGKWYWLNSDGSMSSDTIQQIGDTFYAFDASGAMLPKAIKITSVDA